MGAGTVWTPLHTTPGPLQVGTGGAYRLSMTSGTMAASLGANAELFQFRYVTAASRVCLIHGISISATIITLPAVSATVLVGPFTFRATAARAWTAAGSGGTRATLTTNQAKLRTAHATSEVNDAGISTTAGLTVGTKTLDTQDIGSVVCSTGVLTAVGVEPQGTLVPKTNLMGEFAGSMAFPVVCANQEGIVVRTGAAFPATMTWAFTVDIAWSEVQGF
jgi:hypothetical protein